MVAPIKPKAGPRHVKTFHEALALSSRRLGFSVTQGCPLRCAHCSVGAAPELHANRYASSFTQRIVDQMPEIAAAGITSIDFTGGEPTLMPRFLGEVSAAAAEHGISCGLVTAANWAIGDRQARAMVKRLEAIDHWDISTDRYHLEFVPLSAVERAFRLLQDAGKEPLIRIAHHEPIEFEDATLIDQVMRFAGRSVAFQPIGPVGRGDQVVVAEAADDFNWDAGPCPTTGLLVQWNGRVAPCCAPASHETHSHPLWLGNANTSRMVDILESWRIHPLIQTIRVWGFRPLREWFKEAGLLDGHTLRQRVCDQCVQWLRDPTLVEHAAGRAAELEHRIRLAAALKAHFDEPWLDLALRREATSYLNTGRWPAPTLRAA